jgi:hypothetical protein
LQGAFSFPQLLVVADNRRPNSGAAIAVQSFGLRLVDSPSEAYIIYAQIHLYAQLLVKKTMLTIKPASAIRKIIVWDNGCFNMLCCRRSQHTIHHFRFLGFEKAMSLFL